MSRLLSWFTTKDGKRFTHVCVGVTAFTVLGVKLAIHGPLLNKVKEICQIYKQDKPKPFSTNLSGIIEQVLNDSNLKEEQKKKIQFFYVVGHEPFHAGEINSPWGGIIGLPFFFGETEEFKIKDLRLHGKDTVDWIIEGRDLLDSFVLTDSAKKFAIMREIYSLNYSDVITNAVIAAGCIILPAKFAQKINHASKAFERLILRQRIIRYSLFYAAGYILYRLLKDPLKHLSDGKADRLAAEKSIEYLSGGIEFYEKTLMKNKALQELSNSRFKTYDEKGDESYFLLVPKLPISKRLENLKKMKKEKRKKAEENV